MLVIGTEHEIQRYEDTISGRQPLRAEFERRLRRIIKKGIIDLLAEEAGDDEERWGMLKLEDDIAAEFGGAKTSVDHPVSTIGKMIADQRGVGHKDVDVKVRANEDDSESIKKRSDAIAERILDVLACAKRVLVIVGKKHRSDIEQRLKEKGLFVKSFEFP